MSLELKIESLTAAVIALTAKMESGTVTPAAVTVAAPVVAAPAPVVVAPAPVVVAPLVQPAVAVPASVTPTNPALSQPAAVAMPAPPSFVAPTPVVAAVGAPFSDPKGLIEFVMTSYKNLGPAKGAGIQGVLTGLGYQNINDVKPDHYAALFSGIESLKA